MVNYYLTILVFGQSPRYFVNIFYMITYTNSESIETNNSHNRFHNQTYHRRANFYPLRAACGTLIKSRVQGRFLIFKNLLEMINWRWKKYEKYHIEEKTVEELIAETNQLLKKSSGEMTKENVHEDDAACGYFKDN